MANDINVYFCDRQSPWQRGSKTKAKSLISMIEKSQFEFLGKDTSLSALLKKRRKLMT